MTREEAINIVQGARQYLTAGNPIWDAKKIDEAMHMAIEALSAPQTDLISRADAIKAVEQEYRIDRGYMVDDYTYGFNQAIQYVSDIILQDLPSAEAVSREDTVTLNSPISIQAEMVAVVRCKDCRYFKKIVERSDSGLCYRDLVASAWKENGYCSRGERKGGEDE